MLAICSPSPRYCQGAKEVKNDSETISAIILVIRSLIHIYSDRAVFWAYENACRHCQLS